MGKGKRKKRREMNKYVIKVICWLKREVCEKMPQGGKLAVNGFSGSE